MKTILVLATTVVAAGCASVSTNATLMDPSLHLARICPAAVKLYTDRDRVKTEYREVALLNSSGLTRYSDEDELMESMRKKAASIGANGIILSGISEPSAATKVAAEVSNVVTKGGGISPERKGRALAIFVPSDSSNAAVACASAR